MPRPVKLSPKATKTKKSSKGNPSHGKKGMPTKVPQRRDTT